MTIVSASQPLGFPGDLRNAQQLLECGSFQAAWQSVVEAIELRPFHPEAYLMLARISGAAGDRATARRCASKAGLLTPNWAVLKSFAPPIAHGNQPASWAGLESIMAPPKWERLTVCMIVKNEEAFLARCLDSVRDITFQIIVVDTGSTDRTPQIAREHGAELYEFAWNDDFSAARNAGLVHARGDWVLMLDADEELLPEGRAMIRAAMANPTAVAGYLRLVNVGREDEGGPSLPRMFRNIPGAHYRGRIHEEVFSSVIEISKPWGLKFIYSDAVILHHGYTPQVTANRGKIQRNLRLLQQAVAEPSVTPLARANLLMNLGLETVRSEQLEEGVRYYQQALELANQQLAAGVRSTPEFRATLIRQLATHLVRLRRFQEVLTLFASPLATGSPLSASDHYAWGLACFETGNLSSAVMQFEHCIAKRNQPDCIAVNKGALSSTPYHCLALALASLGRRAEASDVCLKALEQFDNEPTLHLFRARLIYQEGRAVEALKAISGLIGRWPDNQDAWALGGEIALSHPQLYQFGNDWTSEAFRLHSANARITAQRAEILLLSNNPNDALKLPRPPAEALDARSLAALVFCEILSGAAPPTPIEPAMEQKVSGSLIDLYRRLIAGNAPQPVNQLNASLDQLAMALPTAAGMLKQAIRRGCEAGANPSE